MPTIVTFAVKRTNEPITFQAIDDAMRIAFNQPPDDTNWLYGWYDIIGTYLACGISLSEQLEQRMQEPGDDNLIRVLTYLDAFYTTDAYHQPF